MKKEQKILIIFICSILFLLVLLMILLFNIDKDKVIEETTTMTTTEIIIESKEMIDDKTKISIKLIDEKYFNNELLIENIENIFIENSILAYDINFVDENSNKVHVENTNLLISIPYVNVNNYSQFKVLHIDENNNILETINAIYESEKIIFNVNYLSRYVVLGLKDEETTTTTKKSTTKHNNNSNTTKTTSKNSATTTTKISSNSNKTTTKIKKETVTVTFDTKGFGNVSSQTIVKNNKVSKPNNPKAEGMHFIEWQHNGEKFDFNKKITEDITLTAKWDNLQRLVCSIINSNNYSTIEGKDQVYYANGKYNYNVSCGKYNYSIPVFVEFYKNGTIFDRSVQLNINQLNTVFTLDRGDNISLKYKICTNVNGYKECTGLIDNNMDIYVPTEELNKIDFFNLNYNVRFFKNINNEEVSSLPEDENYYNYYYVNIYTNPTSDINVYYLRSNVGGRYQYNSTNNPIRIRANTYKSGIILCGAKKLSNGIIYIPKEFEPNNCVTIKSN